MPTSTRLRRLACAAVCLAVLQSSCASRPPFSVEIADGVPVQELTVRLHSRDGTLPLVRQVRVGTLGRGGRPEGGNGFWYLAAAGQGSAPLTEFRYGTAPAGFTGTRAQDLAPGGYVIDITAADGSHATSRFGVTREGRVRSASVPAT